METAINKPVYYDGSGQLPKAMLDNLSKRQPVKFTEEARKYIGANPFYIHSNK